MHVVHPGSTAPDGDFTFVLQARYHEHASREVKFALIPSDAEKMYKELEAYLKVAAKG